jgi:hypothetical protein
VETEERADFSAGQSSMRIIARDGGNRLIDRDFDDLSSSLT